MTSRRIHLRLDISTRDATSPSCQLTPLIQLDSFCSNMFHPGLSITLHSLQAVSSTVSFLVPATTSELSVTDAPSNRIHASRSVEFVCKSSLTACCPIGRSFAPAPVPASDPLIDSAVVHESAVMPGAYARSNEIADPVKFSSIDAACPPRLIHP